MPAIVQAKDARPGRQYTTDRGQQVTVEGPVDGGDRIQLRIDNGQTVAVPPTYGLRPVQEEGTGLDLDLVVGADRDVVEAALPNLGDDQLDDLEDRDGRAWLLEAVAAERDRREGGGSVEAEEAEELPEEGRCSVCGSSVGMVDSSRDPGTKILQPHRSARAAYCPGSAKPPAAGPGPFEGADTVEDRRPLVRRMMTLDQVRDARRVDGLQDGVRRELDSQEEAIRLVEAAATSMPDLQGLIDNRRVADRPGALALIRQRIAALRAQGIEPAPQVEVLDEGAAPGKWVAVDAVADSDEHADLVRWLHDKGGGGRWARERLDTIAACCRSVRDSRAALKATDDQAVLLWSYVYEREHKGRATILSQIRSRYQAVAGDVEALDQVEATAASADRQQEYAAAYDAGAAAYDAGTPGGENPHQGSSDPLAEKLAEAWRQGWQARREQASQAVEELQEQGGRPGLHDQVAGAAKALVAGAAAAVVTVDGEPPPGWARDHKGQEDGDPELRCPELHPVTGRQCESGADHPWDHGYGDDRIDGAGTRVWWKDARNMRPDFPHDETDPWPKVNDADLLATIEEGAEPAAFLDGRTAWAEGHGDQCPYPPASRAGRLWTLGVQEASAIPGGQPEPAEVERHQVGVGDCRTFRWGSLYLQLEVTAINHAAGNLVIDLVDLADEDGAYGVQGHLSIDAWEAFGADLADDAPIQLTVPAPVRELLGELVTEIASIGYPPGQAPARQAGQVYAALDYSPRPAEALASDLDLSRDQVGRALSHLVGQDMVERHGRGVYRLPYPGIDPWEAVHSEGFEPLGVGDVLVVGNVVDRDGRQELDLVWLAELLDLDDGGALSLGWPDERSPVRTRRFSAKTGVAIGHGGAGGHAWCILGRAEHAEQPPDEEPPPSPSPAAEEAGPDGLMGGPDEEEELARRVAVARPDLVAITRGEASGEEGASSTEPPDLSALPWPQQVARSSMARALELVADSDGQPLEVLRAALALELAGQGRERITCALEAEIQAEVTCTAQEGQEGQEAAAPDEQPAKLPPLVDELVGLATAEEWLASLERRARWHTYEELREALSAAKGRHDLGLVVEELEHLIEQARKAHWKGKLDRARGRALREAQAQDPAGAAAEAAAQGKVAVRVEDLRVLDLDGEPAELWAFPAGHRPQRVGPVTDPRLAAYVQAVRAHAQQEASNTPLAALAQLTQAGAHAELGALGLVIAALKRQGLKVDLRITSDDAG